MPPCQPNQSLLQANVHAIGLRSPAAAAMISRASGIEAVNGEHRLEEAQDGNLTGIREGLRLASAYAPMAEGQRWADSIDIAANSVFVVRGFGCGHHVLALAKRLGNFGSIIVFEPDADLLRSVLSRVDIRPWMALCPILFVMDESDKGELVQATSGLEGQVALGTVILDHPSSRARLKERSRVFGEKFAEVVAAVRTSVVTTLVHVETSMRNAMLNAEFYIRSASSVDAGTDIGADPGIACLKGLCAGTPAVVVSAGPSLRHNVELLRRQGVRERVVIIAVQTVLRQLLDMGIRPHYVTALDYHEISGRFYEGLSASDVEGVTLVVEPKCHPVITRSFPGVVRCVGDELLDHILGDAGRSPEHAGPHAMLEPGATVAHLAYRLARHLGCDPVILIGQDLGFTDHQYYGPGAAIHRVWSGELSELRTLEMMEWERVARMRGLLRSVSDMQGRSVYTDEQMSTYRVQFESAFQKDRANGLHVIDATEGGVCKQHATSMPLSLALERYAISTSQTRQIVCQTRVSLDEKARQRVQDRIRVLRAASEEMVKACRATILDLTRMTEHDVQERVRNDLIERVRERAERLRANASYTLVMHLNQTGALNRARADRAIALATELSDEQRQLRQIERDMKNVQWTGEAAQRFIELLDEAATVLAGGPIRGKAASLDGQAVSVDSRRHVAAIIHADTARSALGLRRNWRLDEGTPVLSRTLDRLEKCEELDSVILACDGTDVAMVRELVSRRRPRKDIKVVASDLRELRDRRARVRASRLWSRHCWRGAAGGLTVYDELLCPTLDSGLLKECGADAAVCIGDDWCLVDPRLTDAVIARYRESPKQRRLTFSQAAPGLCGALIDRTMMEELASVSGLRSTLALMLGYTPHAPRMDPIAKDPCVPVPPSVRDALLRVTWDDVNTREAWRAVLRSHGEDAWAWDAARVVKGLHDAAPLCALQPEVVEVHAHEWGWESVAECVARVRALASLQPALGVVIHDQDGSGEWRALADGVLAAGAAGVQLRTTDRFIQAESPQDVLDALDVPIDVLSIALPADSREVWHAIRGADTRDLCWDALQGFIDERSARHGQGIPRTWLVPRIARCDATLEEIERFYDRWLIACGACVIDPPSEVRPWEKLCSLPVPSNVLRRLAWSRTRLHPSRHGVLEGAI